MNLIIGSHVSFKSDKQLLGSVNEALSYGENTFMFYTGAPQNTIRSNINDNLTNKALEVMKENNINIDNVIVHAPYIVNLAKEDNDFAISFLKQEIKRCSMLHIKYMVLHPGSSVSITKEEGINNIINALNIILDNEYDVTICLETMAGKGNEVGSNLLEIKNIINKIINKLENNRVSVLTFIGDYKNLINDLASSINYDILKVNNNMEKIFDKLKYNPSTIFVVNSLDNYNFNNIIKKAKENNLVEYNNEYVSFNSAIVIYTLKENNIGFINSASDDIIYFDKITQ